MGVLTTFTVAAGHPALAGHFPGAPIVPGVLLLDETVRAVERSQGDAPRRWQIGAAKFLKPVRPGESLSVEHERLPNGSIRFLVSSGASAVARGVLRPVGAAPAARASGARWAGEPERGSASLVAAMIRLSLALGRPLARVLLCPIAGYFFLFGPTVRTHARAYLRRALGRVPTARDRFCQVYAFACTILDRLYLMKGRYDLFTISIEGEPLMRATLEGGGGAFLLGAHLGSFEVMGAVGRRQPGLRVVMAMYEDNATRLNAMAAFADPQYIPEVIPLGHLEAMLRIRERLDQGCFVGMLADRTIGEAPAERVGFLGSPALFPSGPMRAAAALRRPVFFMTGLYRGGNRYHVVFRQIADFARVGRGERERAVREAVVRYAALLEEFCRSDPCNWFNFYDFWHDGAGAGGPAARGAGT